MDIDILLVLQVFREGVGGCLTEFFSKLTWFGEMNVVLIIMGLLYWCVSKQIGTYLLMGWSANRIVNGLLKVAACTYRPWIRDARIIPEQNALEAATGYSFPSGHSMNAASLFGGLAIRRDMRRGLRVLMWIILCLIAFSRIFLGVHTPQDIVVGAIAGVLVMFLTGKLCQWLESNPSKDMLVAVIGVGIAIAVAIFSAVKPYPADYDADGKLLFVKFTTDVTMQERFLRLTGGLLGYYVIYLIINPLIKAAIPGFAGTITTCFLQMFYIVFLFPLAMARFGSNSKGDIAG